jgi:outer membrane receptor protein involved in Fe transport
MRNLLEELTEGRPRPARAAAALRDASALCLPLLILCLIWSPTLAAPGSGMLRGTVRDSETGDRIAGAGVLVVGTTLGCNTDLDGEYRLTDVPAGTYAIKVTAPGYEPFTQPNVTVREGEDTKLDAGLRRTEGSVGSYTIEDLYVTADRIMSTQAAVISERMKSITVGDAISAEQISKSPDGTGGDVLKRVTGLSVVDGKFVFVRGITDRYNVTQLDGVPVSATDTDVDRRSFSFDVLPAGLLANTVVVKTAMPDLPGDFSGGVVRLTTKDIPSERTFSVSAGSGYEEGSNFESLSRSQGGDTDWVGLDDGSRSLPQVPAGAGGNYNELARALPNNWATHRQRAPLNGSYGVSYGDRLDLGANDGNQVVGVSLGLKYSSSYSRSEFLEAPKGEDGQDLYHLEGTRDRHSVLWSGLANLSYRPSRNHLFTARTIYVRGASDQVSYAEGRLGENSTTPGKSYTIEWDERANRTMQVGGTHRFGSGYRAPELSWKVFGSSASAYEPDRKRAEYEQNALGTYLIKLGYRSWSDLKERSGGASVDFEMPFGESSVKLGAFFDRRRREYWTDNYATNPSTVGSPNWWILSQPIETIFAPENYGTRKFTMLELNTYTGVYNATQSTDAYYGMAVHPFSIAGQRLRAAGGLRVEASDQEVEAWKGGADGEFVPSRIKTTDALPSVNLTYTPLEWANLRLAYFRSLNRPELREMADVRYYDFNESQNVEGNPDLKRALIHNFDVRLEAFPAGDEVLAVSFFYKDLENAIEAALRPNNEYRYTRWYFNSPKGHNQGFEIEARKNLGFVAGFLSAFTLAGNYSRVFSAVEYDVSYTWQDDEGNWHVATETRTRPMQGQAPWALNGSLTFTHPAWGTTVSVLYNRIGRRLEGVGDDRSRDIYEEPRDLLDAALSQRLFGWLEVKLAAKNLTGADDVLTMGSGGVLHSRVSSDPSFSLSLSVEP